MNIDLFDDYRLGFVEFTIGEVRVVGFGRFWPPFQKSV